MCCVLEGQDKMHPQHGEEREATATEEGIAICGDAIKEGCTSGDEGEEVEGIRRIGYK